MHTHVDTMDSVKRRGTIPMGKKRKTPKQQQWDGWSPTPEELKARLKRASVDLPFWKKLGWGKVRVESIEELATAFRFSTSEMLVRAFDYSRLPHRGSPYMSADDREIYDRMKDWLKEMQDDGMRRYVSMIVDSLLNETLCPDMRLLARAIDLHVGLRKRDMARRLQRRMGAGRVS